MLEERIPKPSLIVDVAIEMSFQMMKPPDTT